jgi:uncharacterized protein YkwD
MSTYAHSTNRRIRRSLTTLGAVAAVAIAAPALANAQDAPAPASSSCANANTIPTAATLRQATAAVTCVINEERVEGGLQPVVRQARLAKAANAFSADMVRRHYLSHTSPTGQNLGSRLKAARFGLNASYSAGEIIGSASGSLATPAEMVEAWLDSPEHRDAMLDPTFTQIGAGVAIGDPQAVGSADQGATYAVEFAQIIK